MTVPLTAVFTGELTTDLIVAGKSSHEDPATSFLRTDMNGEEWARHVSNVAGMPDVVGIERVMRRVEVAPGGSLANVAAAFRAHSHLSACKFACIEEPRVARLRRPLWWLGYDASAADLAARSIRVIGAPLAPQLPQLPGALVITDSQGLVSRLHANSQLPRASPHVQGDILLIRSDHLKTLNPKYLAEFSRIAVLLADDGAGLDAAVASIKGRSEAWLFGRKEAVETVHRAIGYGDRLMLVGTDGARDCTVWDGHRGTLRLSVPPVEKICTDLGAGDAYMGAFVARALDGASIELAHDAACASARCVMQARGARIGLEQDLNRIFPDIDRSSPQHEEGRIFFEVRRSPGMVVVTGGQTGVDGLAAEEAVSAGLPAHIVFPAGLRRENGVLTTPAARRFGRARIHNLGSPSFRYRTWATVYFADAVILIDRAGGEGSEETRRAARILNRPLLDLRSRLAPRTEIDDWLRLESARVVLIAGSRASLMAQSKSGGGLRKQIREVIAALCFANCRLLGADQAYAALNIDQLTIASALRTCSVVSEIVQKLGSPAVRWIGARDAATAFRIGCADAVVTWPSLIPRAELVKVTVIPLGMYSVHYGILLAPAELQAQRLLVQYEEAFRDNVAGEIFEGSIPQPIEGNAEDWMRYGWGQAAFDSFRTGATMASRGLDLFFPSNWETAALILRGGRTSPNLPTRLDM